MIFEFSKLKLKKKKIFLAETNKQIKFYLEYQQRVITNIVNEMKTDS